MASFFEFLERVIGHIVWPSVVIFLIWRFGDQFRSVLGRVERIKHKNTEISISKEVEKVEQAAIDTNMTIFYPSEVVRSVSSSWIKNESKMGLLAIWTDIEIMLRNFSIKKNIYFHGAVNEGTLIRKFGLLEPIEIEIFHRLRRVRNALIHGESDVSDAEAAILFGAAKSLRDRLERRLADRED